MKKYAWFIVLVVIVIIITRIAYVQGQARKSSMVCPMVAGGDKPTGSFFRGTICGKGGVTI